MGQGGGREGADRAGGPPESSAGATKVRWLGSLNTLTNNWSDWLATRGRQGEAWGDGPGRRAGRGQMGGPPGSNEGAWFLVLEKKGVGQALVPPFGLP